MDKFEYKVRAEEINTLISQGKYAEAVEIADTIDWHRVKSVMMLCKISDLYKINRRYPESRDVLLLAYEKHPTRLIVYSLCELAIKMEEYVQAIEYYKEFVQIAPKDTGRYILQYRLYEAQDVSLEERIAVLEEFKKRDYREKWAYELAYLYHRIGLSTKCVEECDEMFLWFGEGKYVVKALELKKLHEPLNEDQQDRYDLWMQARETREEPYGEEESGDDGADAAPEDSRTADEDGYAGEGRGFQENMTETEAPTTELPEVKTVDVGQYNTINLQMVVAEGMRELMGEENAPQEAVAQEIAGDPYGQEDIAQEDITQEAVYTEEVYPAENGTDIGEEAAEAEVPEAGPDTDQGRDTAAGSLAEPAGKSEGTYREEVLQKPAVYEEVPAEEAAPATYEEEPEEEPIEDEDLVEPDDDAITKALIAPLMEETIRLPDHRQVEKKLQERPVTRFPGKTDSKETKAAGKPAMETDGLEEVSSRVTQEGTAAYDAQQILEQMKQEVQKKSGSSDADRIPGARTGVLTPLNTKPSKYDNILSQEYDGQISLVMPEAERVEKQITGQLSIEDIMAEWEEVKKTNEQKRMEDVRQRILAHTGNLFADFDEATKNGLLEELERAFVAAIMKESGKKPAIKKVILPDDMDQKPSAARQAKPKPAPEVAREDIPEETEEPEETMEPEAEDVIEAGLEEEIPTGPGKEESLSGDGQQESDSDRELTEEEKELFGEFIHHRKTERQLIQTLDNMSLAPYTGNVLITGEEEETTLALAKALIRDMQLNDSNFSGKVAKISAAVLNKKDVEETFGKLDNGALIIEKASRLKPVTAARMVKALDKDNMGLLILMIDQKQDMNQLLAENPALNTHFNLRMDVEALDDEALVAYAKQYAEDMEYSIDEFGILALHTRIADMQTSDHEVNMAEVRDLVDEAIYYANKKTPGHFMDILLAKRYNEDDMIILREKDFMH